MSKALRIITIIVFVISFLLLIGLAVTIGTSDPLAKYVISIAVVALIGLIVAATKKPWYWILVLLQIAALALAIINPVYLGT